MVHLPRYRPYQEEWGSKCEVNETTVIVTFYWFRFSFKKAFFRFHTYSPVNYENRSNLKKKKTFLSEHQINSACNHQIQEQNAPKSVDILRDELFSPKYSHSKFTLSKYSSGEEEWAEWVMELTLPLLIHLS